MRGMAQTVQVPGLPLLASSVAPWPPAQPVPMQLHGLSRLDELKVLADLGVLSPEECELEQTKAEDARSPDVCYFVWSDRRPSPGNPRTAPERSGIRGYTNLRLSQPEDHVQRRSGQRRGIVRPCG